MPDAGYVSCMCRCMYVDYAVSNDVDAALSSLPLPVVIDTPKRHRRVLVGWSLAVDSDCGCCSVRLVLVLVTYK
jgi:hypothetical protein